LAAEAVGLAVEAIHLALEAICLAARRLYPFFSPLYDYPTEVVFGWVEAIVLFIIWPSSVQAGVS
jgi:hypothetical protein